MVPPLNQGRYSYLEQPAVADCAEMCARSSAMRCYGTLPRSDLTSLIPPNASGGVRIQHPAVTYGDLRRLQGDTR